MIEAPPRYTLHGEVTHYPDNTWTATLWLNDDGLPTQSWSTPHYHGRQAAIDAVVNEYRKDEHLPTDTIIHVVMKDKMVGVLTPECPGPECVCHQPPSNETGHAEDPLSLRLRFMRLLNRPTDTP